MKILLSYSQLKFESKGHVQKWSLNHQTIVQNQWKKGFLM